MDYRWIIDGQSSLLLPAKILLFHEEKENKSTKKCVIPQKQYDY
jgi:hypothetical protein